jgi:hypothetical protein
MDTHNIKSRVNYRNTEEGNDNYKQRTLGLPDKKNIIVIVIIQLN